MVSWRNMEQVIKIAGRSPQIYPPGAYAALEARRHMPSLKTAALSECRRQPWTRLSGPVLMTVTARVNAPVIRCRPSGGLHPAGNARFPRIIRPLGGASAAA
jgi:hypothetical protein